MFLLFVARIFCRVLFDGCFLLVVVCRLLFVVSSLVYYPFFTLLVCSLFVARSVVAVCCL